MKELHVLDIDLGCTLQFLGNLPTVMVLDKVQKSTEL